MPEKNGYTSIKVREEVRAALLKLQSELSLTGLQSLPKSVRPDSLGLGEIIMAGVKSLEGQRRK